MPIHLSLVLLLAATFAACGGQGPTPSATTGSSPVPTSAPPASTVGPTEATAYKPTPRTSAAMAWDPTSKTILLFGGDTNGGASNALDRWDGTAWTSLGGGPPARDDALLVSDPERGVVMLAGGRNGRTVQTDTWEWNGTTWKKIAVEGPTPRAHAAAAYDPASKRILVYGGVSEAGTLRDTWAWDGVTWTRIETRGIPGLVPNGMAWDPTRKQLLVLAVNLDAPNADQTFPSELWGWTGESWTLVAGDGPSFSPLQQFTEGPKHPWLVDGGAVQGAFSTVEWTGDAWLPLVGTMPTVRNGQAVAYDRERHQFVLFGGFLDNTIFGDTWVLDGGAWRAAGS